MEKPRILIVDDSSAIHEDFKKVLTRGQSESNGELSALESQLFGKEETKAKIQYFYDLDFALQGTEAVEKVKAGKNSNRPYSLIFMDVRMPPGIDGVEAIKLIWQVDPYVEVVLCTAFMDYSHDDIIKHLGGNDRLLFLKKPFDPVAVSQLAITLTTKWSMSQQARLHMKDMEGILQSTSKMAEMGQMTGGIAHELNSPLAVLQLLSEDISIKAEEDPPNMESIKNSAKTMIKTVTRIAGIIRGLKTLSREASRDDLKEERVVDLIEDTLFFCRGRFKKGSVGLSVGTVSPDLRILCRGPQVSQVLLNLLNNAYDAVQSYEEKWVKVDAGIQGDWVTISVTDSGKGITSEVQNRLFQPFFTTKASGHGTGLGLSVSRSIMESHGGQLSVDSLCSNTRFQMTIPVRK